MNTRLQPRLIAFLILTLLLAACGSNSVTTNTPVPAGGPTTAASPVGGGSGEPTGEPIATSASEPTAPVEPTTEANATAPVEETSSAAGPTAAGGPAAQASATSGSVKMLNLALMINGTLGDKGFFDSAKAGTDRAKAELGAKVRVVEERDAANWESVLRQLAQGDYDVIVLGTFQMVDALNNVAPEFPNQKFILFDATVDQPNVANIVYAQNEGSFLAGALAGCVVSRSEMKGLSGDKVIGAVGGLDIDVINDFIVGYEQGAKYVDPEIEVLKAYNSGANAFEDPNKGKELANAQLEQGAGVVFNVAGKTGLGVLEAASEAGRYSVGVDSNQNALYPGSVLTSMLKRVDNSVFDLIQIEATSSLRTGRTYPYGIQNEGVGLAEDALYDQHVPQACKDQVEKAKRDIASGKVEVATAFK